MWKHKRQGPGAQFEGRHRVGWWMDNVCDVARLGIALTVLRVEESACLHFLSSFLLVALLWKGHLPQLSPVRKLTAKGARHKHKIASVLLS